MLSSTRKAQLQRKKNEVLISLRIPKQVHEVLRKLSIIEDRTVSSLIRKILKDQAEAS